MKMHNLTCIGCPLGCSITVITENEKVVSVSGNTCPNGDTYARKEVTCPTRIVTSTVRALGSRTGAITVPCKTREDIPKEKIFDVIRDIKTVTVTTPIQLGDVIRPNVAGTGVDMIATKTVE